LAPRLPRFLFLAGLLCPFGSPLFAQLSDWSVGGRFQFLGTHVSSDGQELLVHRARLWADGRLHPKLSVRFQYGFRPRRLFDLFVNYDPKPNLELRLGINYLPFIGDFTEAPFFLDTIDFPAGRLLFPAREVGAFVSGTKGQLAYNVSVVRGSGFRGDENSWKDVCGFVRFPALTRRLTFGLAHYEGRAGPNGSLVPKRRSATDMVGEAHDRLTLKAAYVRGLDGRISTDAAWFRAVVHAAKSVDIVGEYDTVVSGPRRRKWFDLGVNYKLRLPYSDLKFHYRRFQQPRKADEIKVQLQLFFFYPWRWT